MRWWSRQFALRVRLPPSLSLSSSSLAGLTCSLQYGVLTFLGIGNRLKPSPMLLIYHFFSVALYSIYILFTTPVHRHPISSTSSPSPSSSSSSASDTEEEEEKEGSEKSEMEDVLLPPSFVQYPALTLKSARVFWTALVVLAPVLWNEGQM